MCVKTLCATEVYVTELCAPVCDRVVCVTMLCDAKDRARHQRQPGAASATPATQEQHRWHQAPRLPRQRLWRHKALCVTKLCVCDKVVRGRVVCVCVWQNCVCVCCVCVCDKVAVWKSCVWRSVGDKVVVWKSCVWQSCGWQSCVLQSFVWQKLWVTPSCYGTRWNCALCEPMSCVFYLKLRPLENLGLIFTGVFYRVFAWTRKRGHNVFLPW